MSVTMDFCLKIAFGLFSLSLISTMETVNLPDGGKLWAVLVAGSNTYYNYRHQADICHSYQILHSHGIPDERIIVMMYDDIAFNEENPTPGIIINHPNGSNVYVNVPKDYTGSHVTAKNFLSILLGEEEKMSGIGSGKVLKSGPNDHVFVNFADHGGPGVLSFPDTELYVSDFTSTLKKMSEKKLYKKMVIYVEACESGSMFPKRYFSDNINIFATTAANATESSFGCYYDKKRDAYLGDVYSIKWMEDSDAEDLEKETLSEQYNLVKKEVNESHVLEFGDLSIGKLKVGDFQGDVEPKHRQNLPTVPLDAVPAPEIPVHVLKNKFKQLSAKSEEYFTLQKKMNKLYSNREFLKKVVDSIVKKSVSNTDQFERAIDERMELNEIECYVRVAKYFSKNCFSISRNDYSLRHLYKLVNLCEMGIKPRHIEKAMDIICVSPPIYGIY